MATSQPHPHSLKILSWNSNGILNKYEFKSFASNSNYDIICIQETYLNENKNFKIRGYTTLSQYCDSLHNKRGLLILIKSNLEFFENKHNNPLEYQHITVKLQNHKLDIFNIYASPSIDYIKDDFHPLFTHTSSLLVGDFNAHNSLWHSNKTTPRGYILEDLLNDEDFVVHNNKQPTYLHHNGTTSILDLSISSSNIASKIYFTVLNNTFCSDHNPIAVTINPISPPVTNFEPKWNLKKANWELFTDICNNTLTTEQLYNPNPNQYYQNVLSSLTTAANSSIPYTKPYNGKKQRSKNLPYWNDSLSETIYKRNCARNKFIKTKLPEHGIIYRRLKAQTQKEIRQAARNHWAKFCSTLDKNTSLGKVWKLVKAMSGNQQKPHLAQIPLLVNSNTVIDNKEKADIIATHFSTVSHDNNFDPRFLTLKQQNEPAIKLAIDSYCKINCNIGINQKLGIHELLKAIRELKEKSTPGIDKISYTIIKHLPISALHCLLDFYNYLWETGTFPKDWQHSIIIPIPKPNKDLSEPSSYRPISLTSTLCKLMEKIITERLTWHLETNHLIDKNQCGFRKGHSTIDHIVKLQDTINSSLRVGHHTLAIFIDFEKAFDMVWKNGLLLKLVNLGINGNILAYIKNFLTDRTFQVKIQNVLSAIFSLINGTPQGSVISPILFLIIINDLLQHLSDINCSLFADDSSIYKSGSSIPFLIKNLQTALNSIQSWCIEWGFKISSTKTEAICFSNSRLPEIKLFIDGKEIPVVKEVKFLGVVFDTKLTWSKHIDLTVQKCQKRINILKAVTSQQWGASKKILLTMYKALIRSILDYGCISYDSASKAQLAKLEKVKNQTLRICVGAIKSTAIQGLEVDCGELPLPLRRLEQICKHSLKIKLNTHHPANTILQDNWRIHYGKFSLNNLPIQIKIKPFFDSIENLEIHNVPYTPPLPPWQQKPFKVYTHLTLEDKKQENPEKLKSKTLTYISTFLDHIHIYTDASKYPNGKTGIGIYSTLSPEEYPSPPQLKLSLRLSDNQTIYTAELTAIKIALQTILSAQNSNNPPILTKVVIFSDSLSSLQTLQSAKSHSRPGLLSNIQQIYAKITYQVSFVWIPSHIGICGNEIADKLANDATSQANIDVNVKYEIQDIFTYLSSFVDNLWQRQWDLSSCFYRHAEKCVSRQPKFINETRSSETFIARFRMGRLFLNKFLHQINKHSTGLCDTCRVPETTQHFLFNCNNNITKNLKSWCTQQKIEYSLQHVLNNKNILLKIKQECHRII